MLRPFFPILPIILGCLVLTSAAQAQTSPLASPIVQTCRIRLLISSFAKPNDNFSIIEPTIKALESAFPQGEFCWEQKENLPSLMEDVKNGKGQIILSSSGMYYRLKDFGVHGFAAITGGSVSDPNKAEGSVIIANKTRDDLNSLKSIKGMVLAANTLNGFTGHLTGLREFAKQGFNTDNFFSKIIFLGSPQENVLKAVANGHADVGIVRTCLYEQLLIENPELNDKFKIINEQKTEGFRCKHSTELYPSWILGLSRTLTSDEAARAGGAVLSMPATASGLHWGIATDFTAVDNLYKDLRLGPYEFMRRWSLECIWNDFKWLTTPIAVVLLIIVAFMWRNAFLLKRRTQELVCAREKEICMLEHERKLENQMAVLRRMVVVGQLSSMLAHELGQPVSAILLYVQGLIHETETATTSDKRQVDLLHRIEAQTLRIQSIVEYVRGYAKSTQAKQAPIDLVPLLRKTLSNFGLSSLSKHATPTLEVAASCEHVTVYGESIELELVVLNLLRNAAQAAAESSTRPHVRIEVCLDRLADRKLLLSVTDSGEPIPDAVVRNLEEPLTSSKPDGLGLGLAICRTIIERMGGIITFDHGTEGRGLKVSIQLPCAGRTEENHD